MNRIICTLSIALSLFLVACGGHEEDGVIYDESGNVELGRLIVTVIDPDGTMLEDVKVWVEPISSYGFCYTTFNGDHNINCTIEGLPIKKVLDVGIKLDDKSEIIGLVIPENEPNRRVFLVLE